MKAAIYTNRDFGKYLEMIDITPPSPKPGEVLIKTRAASVNPLDWRLKARRPGVDVAGEVVSVGDGVTRFSRGDAVFGGGKGAFAEYVCARATKLAAKPDNISFEEAASVPIAGLTALQALRDKGKLAPGQKVLINGAAGGVGTFAVQIARRLLQKSPEFVAPEISRWSNRSVRTAWSITESKTSAMTEEDTTWCLITSATGPYSHSAAP